MQLAELNQCTGCGACRAICQRKAIAFLEDAEGFPTPYIDTARCVECGLCNQVCPAIHFPTSHQIQTAYAAQILDKNALKVSTSGGMFTLFAREIFRQNGVVYGCVWDERYNAVIRKAEREEELNPMRGSKYVWSWAGDTFHEIEEYLKAGRIVLFSGLPCQAAGLRNYLRKDYSGLYLLTFFCGGGPSPYAFHKYLETITKDIPIEKINLQFRDKEKYGVGVNISYETKHGKIYQSYVRNPYFFSYHTKILHRRSCYHCQYRYQNRIDDITMGDYWGVEKFHADMDRRAGVSALLINTEKGKALLKNVKDKLTLVETSVANIAAYNNLTLSDKKKIYPIPEFREAFFTTLRKKGWKTAERRYLYNKERFKLWIALKMPKNIFLFVRKIIH